MKKVKISVVKTVSHDDLMEIYENPISHACDMQVGMTFVSVDAQIPDHFCDSAWSTLYPFVLTLACGGSDFYDGWMKNRHSAMISCNDGFRPVSFYLETMKE